MNQLEGLKCIEGESNMDNEEALVLKQSIYGQLRDVLIVRMGFEFFYRSMPFEQESRYRHTCYMSLY